MQNSSSSDDDDEESCARAVAHTGRPRPLPSTSQIKRMKPKATAASKPRPAASVAPVVPTSKHRPNKVSKKRSRSNDDEEGDLSDEESSDSMSDPSGGGDSDTSSEDDERSSSESNEDEEGSVIRETESSRASNRASVPVVEGRIVFPLHTTALVDRLERDVLASESDVILAQLKGAIDSVKQSFSSYGARTGIESIRNDRTIDTASCAAVLEASLGAIATISNAAFQIKTERMASEEMQRALNSAKSTSTKLLSVWDSLIPELEDVKKDAEVVVEATARLSSKLVKLHATQVGILEGVANLLESNQS